MLTNDVVNFEQLVPDEEVQNTSPHHGHGITIVHAGPEEQK